jgi:hypothetical protein
LRALHAIGLGVLLVAGSAGEARAQLVDGPVGAIGGLFGGHHSVDPNRDSQSFETTFDLSGGYDRDPNLLVITPTDSGPDLTRWYAGTAAATMRYRAGSLKRNIDASGRTYMNYQSTAGGSLFGGDANINGIARLGRRNLNELTAELQSSYEPGWVFGAFGPSVTGPDDSTIGVAPPTGVFEQRWLVYSGRLGYQHHWNATHITSLTYDNRRLRPVEGGGLESDLQIAHLEQSWAISRRYSFLGAYQFDENVQRDDTLEDSPEIPAVRYQTMTGGVRYERRLSPFRRVSATVRGGVTLLVDSPATRDVKSSYPVASATLEYVPSRRFSLSSEYTRGVVLLAGVSAVPVLNNNLEVTVNGTPTSKLRYSVYGSLSRAEFLTPDVNRANSTDVAGGRLELRYALKNWAAIFTTYAYYHHRIDDPQLTASGFPPRYDRHSVRVGMTIWAPLFGTF